MTYMNMTSSEKETSINFTKLSEGFPEVLDQETFTILITAIYPDIKDT